MGRRHLQDQLSNMAPLALIVRVLRVILVCLLPTCYRHPTPIADMNDLEGPYATYHAHV